MSTEAKIIANRRNAQKSTGPRTPQGKAVASKNSLKHGLLARQAVISTECQAEFDLYRQEFLDELAPDTPMESMLAERVVNLSWRLKRAARIQNQTIDALNTPKSPNPLLAKLEKSFNFKAPDDTQDNSQSPEMALGRLAIKDFSHDRVLEKLLMYERRIENSLYKTVLEFQGLNLLKNLNNNTATPLNPQSPRLIFKENSGEQQINQLTSKPVNQS